MKAPITNINGIERPDGHYLFFEKTGTEADCEQRTGRMAEIEGGGGEGHIPGPASLHFM